MKKIYLCIILTLLAFKVSANDSNTPPDSVQVDPLITIVSQLKTSLTAIKSSVDEISSANLLLGYLSLFIFFLIFVLLVVFLIINKKNTDKKINILMSIDRELGHLSASKSGIVKIMDSKFDSLSRDLSNLQQDVIRLRSRDDAKGAVQGPRAEPAVVPTNQGRGKPRPVASPLKVTDEDLIANAFVDYCKVNDVRFRTLSFFSAKMSESLKNCTCESLYRDSAMKGVFWGSNRLNGLEYWVVGMNDKMYVLPSLSSADAFAEVHPGVFDTRGEITPKTITSIKPAILAKTGDGYSVERRGEIR